MNNTMLFCPVRERPEVFELVLASHRQLQGVKHFRYLDDCGHQYPETSEMIPQECRVDFDITHSLGFGYTYSPHTWNHVAVSRISRIRTAALHTLMPHVDSLIMVDADVVLHPSTAVTLNLAPHPIVSEVFWTKWQPHWPYLPNVWDQHTYNFTGPDSILRLARPGLYQVGGLGAVTKFCLAPRELSLVNYDNVPGLEHAFVGEDRHFCVRAAAAGHQLWADTYCPGFHVYRPAEQLEEAQAWFAAGCPREWFTQRWLTREWEREIAAGCLMPPAPAVEVGIGPV